jgi:hypothetical protein
VAVEDLDLFFLELPLDFLSPVVVFEVLAVEAVSVVAVEMIDSVGLVEEGDGVGFLEPGTKTKVQTAMIFSIQQSACQNYHMS